MSKPILNPQRALVGTVFLLLVSSLLPARWAAVVTSQPRYILTAVMAPADHLLKPMADAIRRPPALTVDLGNQEEYERAKQQMVNLQFRLSQANQRILELSEIRDQFKLVGVGLMPATVTSWSGDPLHPTVTLNRGSRHGLTEGLVVVRGFHLVGRIVNVGPVTSSVGLITAPDTHMIALLKPPTTGTEPREMIAQLNTARGRDLFWTGTDRDDPVRLDDLAYLYDSTWPTQARGFVIGKVTAIDPHPDDPILRRRVTVTPVRSLAHLDHVTVIVPTGEPSIGVVEPADPPVTSNRR